MPVSRSNINPTRDTSSTKEDLVSFDIQQQIRDYVLLRPLPRPSVKKGRIVSRIIMFETIAISLGFIFMHYLPKGDGFWISQSSFLATHLLCFAFCAKRAAIGTIKIYQHYASDNVRRRCMLRPTCSEYALLALQKYSFIKAMIKIYNRVTITCGGSEYKIDYP